MIGLKDSRPFFIQSEVKPKPTVPLLPALCVSYKQLLRVLIGSLYCLCSLWLARVITLVLVLRHSNENCSMPSSISLSHATCTCISCEDTCMQSSFPFSWKKEVILVCDLFWGGSCDFSVEFLLSCLWGIMHASNVFSLSVPANGLVVYCGTIVTDDGKEKKVNIDFEPFKPINTSLYLCDNKFHTEVCQTNCVTISWCNIVTVQC